MKKILDLEHLALKYKQFITDEYARVMELFPRLKERRKQQAGTLSGGEQQMLAMGRALMGKPKMLLMDEPSMGLAPILVKDIFSIIKECNKDGAINSFTKALGKELAISGIKVNAISCGAIDTEMNSFLTQEEREDLENEIPAGRFGTTEEVAKLALYLASDDSNYINGQILSIDGGMS